MVARLTGAALDCLRRHPHRQAGAGAVALVWTIGWFAIVFGGLYMALAFRLKAIQANLNVHLTEHW